MDIRPEIGKVTATGMKNSPLITILLGALTLSALASVVMCWLFISSTREIRTLETQSVLINNNRAVVNALLNDTIEYSKRNPAILPVLESVGWKPAAAGSPSPAKSGSK